MGLLVVPSVGPVNPAATASNAIMAGRRCGSLASPALPAARTADPTAPAHLATCREGIHDDDSGRPRMQGVLFIVGHAAARCSEHNGTFNSAAGNTLRPPIRHCRPPHVSYVIHTARCTVSVEPVFQADALLAGISVHPQALAAGSPRTISTMHGTEGDLGPCPHCDSSMHGFAPNLRARSNGPVHRHRDPPLSSISPNSKIRLTARRQHDSYRFTEPTPN